MADFAPDKNTAAQAETNASPVSLCAPLPVYLPPLFDLGQVVATPAALEALRDAATDASELLHRHERGDWGDLDAEDRAVNRKALLWGQRLLSVYVLSETKEKIWIITEADRSVTTLLLPSEY